MKSTRHLGLVVLMLAYFAEFAIAQDAARMIPPPLFAPAKQESLTTAPAAELNVFAANNESGFHIAGDVGVGCYWAHGGGFSSGPLLGATGSVSVFGERAGVGISWMQFSPVTTRSGENAPHRP